MNKVEVAVIGGGPGGTDCAIRIAQRGKKVAIIERKYFGGTCTNWGCIPTKAMMTSAHLYGNIISKGRRLGIKAQAEVDIKALMKHVKRSILSSRKGSEFLLNKYGVEIIKDEAIIKKGKFYLKNDDSEILADNIVLATGSAPKIPESLNVEGVWTSDNVFELEELPESLLIIGSGVIGVEMATIFSSLGTKVTLVEFMNRIVPFEDIDISQLLENEMRKKKIEIITGTCVNEIRKTDNGFNSSLSSSRSIESSHVLVAIGRKPVYPDGLEKIIKIEKGIETDNNFLTNDKNIYAIGDVRAKVMLAHVASAEGVFVAEKLSGKNSDYYRENWPGVIFSEPEISSTGVKETEKGLPDNLVKFVFPMAANGRANTLAEREGFAKIIAEKDTMIIKGASFIGPFVTDILMEIELAINEKLTVGEVLKSIHPHPTISEIVKDTLEGLEVTPLQI
jgi:dihydrolipoamide dehydrogenase